MGANALLCGVLCLTLPETANVPTLETIVEQTTSTHGKEAEEDVNHNVTDEEKVALVPGVCHVSTV